MEAEDARAEVRSIHSADAPEGLERWRPERPRDFAVLVEAEIGPAGGVGGEVFSVRVVGRDWFVNQPGDAGFRWGRGLLVVDAWDYATVERAIADLCRRAEGEGWSEVARRLARSMDWEFEGYRPPPPR
jgi:hypothetical protein